MDLPDHAHSARCEVVLALSRGDTWRRLRDLSLAHHYVPGIVQTRITTGRDTGVGASRKVYDEDGDALDETVIVWQESEGFVLRLHEGDEGPPLPFSKAHFRYWIEDSDERRTRLSLTLLYDMRWGAGGWLLGVLGAHWAIRRRIDAVGAGLKRFYEGEG